MKALDHRLFVVAVSVGSLLPPVALAQNQSEGLEEVIVTAQRREESLQETSIAIDVMHGDDLTLRGVTNAQELSQLDPALTIDNGGGISGHLYMRGVGNRANNNYLDPAITINYDGVPMARASATSTGAFFDLERVEILKGPQGTLYGRNATGGVLNIVPVAPKIGETEGYLSGSAGNFSAMQIEGAVNLQAGDNSAFRLAGSKVEHDGYNRDGTGDADVLSLRAQFLTEVSDSVSIRLAADYTDVGGAGSGTTPVGSYAPAGPHVYAFVPAEDIRPGDGTNTPEGNAFRESVLSAPGFGFLSAIQDDWYVDGKFKGVNAEINIDTGPGTLTLIPAWRETTADSMFNGPGFNSGWYNNSAEQTSLEARFTSDAGETVDYVVGAYYFDETSKGNNTFNQEFVLPLQNYVHDAKQWAVFSQLTFELNDSTRLVTGVRYTDDKRDISGGIDNFITFCGGLPPNLITPPASFAQGCAAPDGLPRWPTLDTVDETYAFLFDNGWADPNVVIPIPPGYLIPLTNGVGQILHNTSVPAEDLSNDEVTYRVVLEKDVAEDSLFYAGFEHGYRSGGLEPQTGAVFDPEYIDAYTIGSKNRFANNSVQLNVELFYWDYSDQQISYFNLNELGVLQNTIGNVGASTNKGADIDLLWAAADNTLVSARLQYLKASYDDLHFYTSAPRDNINCPFTVTGLTADGVDALDFDCSGNQSIYSPELSLQLGLQQTFDLGGLELTASLFSQWADDQVTGFWNLPHEELKAHTRTDVDLTLGAKDGSWSVSAYARNLEDERRLTSSQVPLLGMAMVDFGPPITYGLRANFNF